jgi:hypothetical protein
MMCLWVSYERKARHFFTSLKSRKKVVGSISQRYGSGDPDPLQNVTDPQHFFWYIKFTPWKVLVIFAAFKYIVCHF